jgi:hypothetical protein
VSPRKQTTKVHGHGIDLANGNRVELGRMGDSWVLRCYAREGNAEVRTRLKFSPEALWAVGALILSASKHVAETKLAMPEVKS